jgi:hypothetical protein
MTRNFRPPRGTSKGVGAASTFATPQSVGFDPEAAASGDPVLISVMMFPELIML